MCSEEEGKGHPSCRTAGAKARSACCCWRSLVVA